MNPTNTQQNITQQLQSSGALEQLRNIANQRLGNTATAGVQRTSQAPLQTIPSADRFGKVTNPILPTPVNSQVAQDNLATNVGTFTESATSNQMAAQEAAVAPVSQKQTVLDKISSLLGVQATQGERTQDIFEEAGVAEKRALVTKLENEALTKDRAYQKQAEKIRQNAGGALDIGVQSQLGDLDRKRNSELADIAIQAKVAQGLYTDAVAIAEAKVKAEFEPLENQIKSLQNLYNLYQDDLTASEKLQAQAKIQEQQASLDFQRDKELLAIKNKYDIQSDERAARAAGQKIVKVNGVDYVQNADGTLSIPQVPGGADKGMFIKDKIDTIDSILTDKGLSTAVGTKALFGRGGVSGLFAGSKKQNFIAGVESLTSQLTLDSLIDAKEKGATFGALSDGELKLLDASATKIKTWAKKDKNGNVVGYNINEKDFKAEMDKINNYAKRDFILKGGDPSEINAAIQPDGTVWVKNSDGTITKIY